MKEDMEHIDDFISKKIEEKEFSYREDYWLATEKMIVSDNNRKRLMILVLLTALLFFLTMVFFFANAFRADKTSSSENKKEIPSRSSPEKEYTPIEKEKGYSINHTEDLNSVSVETKSSTVRNGSIGENDLQEISENNMNGNQDANSTVSVLKEKTTDYSSYKIRPKKLKANKTERNFGDQSFYNRDSGLTYAERLPAYLEVPEFYLLTSNSDTYKDQPVLKPYKHFIGVYTGLLYSNGLKPRPTGGLYYVYQFHKNWSAESRFGFKSPTINNIERKSVTTKYDFGRKQNEVIIRSRQTYEMELPLSLKYRLYRQHYASAGVVFNKILSAEYEKISADDGNITSKEKLMSLDDVNPYYMQLRLGYDVLLIKPLRFEAGASYNLTDPLKSGPFVNGSTNKIQYHIIVSYNLFRWK